MVMPAASSGVCQRRDHPIQANKPPLCSHGESFPCDAILGQVPSPLCNHRSHSWRHSRRGWSVSGQIDHILVRRTRGSVQPNGSKALSNMFGLRILLVRTERGGVTGARGRVLPAPLQGGSLTSRLQDCQQCLPSSRRCELECICEVVASRDTTKESLLVL